ncbi:TetR/AcrR family transcriptional regulator [Scandinavium sp. V105_16]|uniref:TetR/AcrR family transcriptional regulator n=1 Tax=Scandinavium lactucae TaxID=3095028 RepID=A0AAJ2S9Z4_9ENTR|nr:MULTISPECIES: TetR/AcrR family transcriptional regulator [unclassified Scandinavium]MDX6022223.1 TetR/AcrR family transcriptional regulator [Scandinavium sp. V105_16]MDX6033935.1 TetR/AcrR family transcriptional regulator [Scandinavium sp. V105_12]MDX6042218.1 TetR/AcrR family transcriptional regulator [Scandinavium sp. V105_6]MDX6052219.1 TetR/AcrR family transcriptional regulator [Scandinavium sp. V105_1]
MSDALDRRSRKRLETRRAISWAATGLFAEKGFDNVTIDEIASAADVGRMTVFNHFPRKEDLFFDRDDEIRDTLADALRKRKVADSAIESLRLLAHRLIAEQRPFLQFSEDSQGFIAIINGSETLKARARAIRDEVANGIAGELARGAGLAEPDADADLAAALLVASWSVALTRAHKEYQLTRDPTRAAAMFLELVDRGAIGQKAALAGTPYA